MLYKLYDSFTRKSVIKGNVINGLLSLALAGIAYRDALEWFTLFFVLSSILFGTCACAALIRLFISRLTYEGGSK